MAASCYSSSQLAAISSTVTEPWSISAPVYQWMFIERTVWAASADTTCNQKGERRRESVNPQIYQVRKATRKEKKAGKYATGICHDRKKKRGKKSSIVESLLLERIVSTPFMSLVLNLTLGHVISMSHGYVLSLKRYFQLLIKTEKLTIFIYSISYVVRILMCL